MILFDDEYLGPRWTYGLNSRPLSTFNVPVDFILFSDRLETMHAYGTVDFPRELTAFEINQFSLTFVSHRA